MVLMTDKFKNILEVPGNGTKLLTAVVNRKNAVVKDLQDEQYLFTTNNILTNQNSNNNENKNI